MVDLRVSTFLGVNEGRESIGALQVLRGSRLIYPFIPASFHFDSPRGESTTPSVRETGTAEDLEAIKNATGNLAGKAYEAAAATYDQNVRPTLVSALEEGQEMAAQGGKRVYKRVKEATGLDEDSLRIPESPS